MLAVPQPTNDSIIKAGFRNRLSRFDGKMVAGISMIPELKNPGLQLNRCQILLLYMSGNKGA